MSHMSGSARQWTRSGFHGPAVVDNFSTDLEAAVNTVLADHGLDANTVKIIAGGTYTVVGYSSCSRTASTS